MGNVPFDSYFFTEEEFYLLLAAVGVTKWNGICMGDEPPQISSETEVNRIVAGLVQKGVATWEGEELKLLSPFLEMFTVFRYAKVCIQSSANGSAEGIACQYVYQGVMARVSFCVRQSDCFKVTLLTPEAWMETLWEESCFSECIEDARPEEPVDLETMEWKDCSVQNCRMDPVLSVFERICLPDGEMQERLVSTDEGVYSYLYLSDGQGCTRFPMSKETSRKLLAKLMREEDRTDMPDAADEGGRKS